MSHDSDYGGRWLVGCGKTVSACGARVASLIDWWLNGIYHAQDDMLRADWSGDLYVEIHLRATSGRFATFDSSLLTRLVVGAHDHCIRVEIRSLNPSHFRLMFHPRLTREGQTWARHPTIEQAIAAMHRPFILGG
jgi:hypothetical protein